MHIGNSELSHKKFKHFKTDNTFSSAYKDYRSPCGWSNQGKTLHSSLYWLVSKREKNKIGHRSYLKNMDICTGPVVPGSCHYVADIWQDLGSWIVQSLALIWPDKPGRNLFCKEHQWNWHLATFIGNRWDSDKLETHLSGNTKPTFPGYSQLSAIVSLCVTLGTRQGSPLDDRPSLC